MEYYQNDRDKKFATNHSDSPDYVSYILVNTGFIAQIVSNINLYGIGKISTLLIFSVV